MIAAQQNREKEDKLTPVIQIFKQGDNIILDKSNTTIEDVYAGLSILFDVLSECTGKPQAELATEALNWYHPEMPLKVRTVNLIRENKYTFESDSDTFIVAEAVDNPEEAIRGAIKEYVESEEGRECVRNCLPYFSWEHALMKIPDELWEKHGLILCRNKDTEIRVNAHEALLEGTQTEEERIIEILNSIKEILSNQKVGNQE